jgi:ribosomal protein L17
MPKNHIFKPRLNMPTKYRWSMLRNMAASLIQHERITVTQATTKALLPLMNHIFRVAMDRTKDSNDKIKGLLRVPDACFKMLHHTVNRFRYN